MALTLEKLAALVLEQLTRGMDEAEIGVEETAIEAVLPDAMRELTNQVYQSSERELLMKEFGFTLAGGVADLSTEPTIHIGCIKEVRYPGELRPRQFLRSRADFDHLPSKRYGYYTVSENLIFTINGDKTFPMNTGAGEFKVLACRIPKTDLSDLPKQLEADLVGECGRLVVERGLMQQPAG